MAQIFCKSAQQVVVKWNCIIYKDNFWYPELWHAIWVVYIQNLFLQ